MTDVAAAAAAVFDRVLREARCDTFLIAFSGGLDSSVLARLAADYARANDVRAVALHVDHALQADSPRWTVHCREVAAALGIRFEAVTLHGPAERGVSIEDWARAARYDELAVRCDAGTCVMTAHHLDDQAETVLHHALRGSGPHGLAGMRELRSFGRARIARPLLRCRRAELLAYARGKGLIWIEDPSNADERFTRNRLRRRVLPDLDATVPGAVRGLGRLARIQGDVADLLDAGADAVIDGAGAACWRLPAVSLRRLDARMRPFVLKRWLARAGFPVPGERHLCRILDEVLDARVDAMPMLRYGECDVRRYDDFLYVMRTVAHDAEPAPCPWRPPERLALAHGWLSARGAREGGGLSPASLSAEPVSIRWRLGGERVRPAGRGQTRTLKKLFQEWRVPPWERGRIPLVFVGDRLAAVGPWCVCEGFAAGAGERALEIVWEPNMYTPPALLPG